MARIGGKSAHCMIKIEPSDGNTRLSVLLVLESTGHITLLYEDSFMVVIAI